MENRNLSKLAIRKGLLKEYNNSGERIVYMEHGDEFQIQLFNPYTYTIGAEIEINGKKLSNIIIIKPGERIWLERFLHSPDKFLFSTYTVNGTSREVYEAIKNNGNIVIKFYKEEEYRPTVQMYYHPYSTKTTKKHDITWIGDSPNWYNSNTVTCYNNNLVGFCTTELTTSAANSASWAAASIDADGNYSYSDSFGNNYVDSAKTLTAAEAKTVSKKIETGRVERGSHSNQKFDYLNINFEYFPFRTEEIKILPKSQKQYTASDLEKKYCPECGRKIKDKFKFCPFCGERL